MPVQHKAESHQPLLQSDGWDSTLQPLPGNRVCCWYTNTLRPLFCCNLLRLSPSLLVKTSFLPREHIQPSHLTFLPFSCLFNPSLFFFFSPVVPALLRFFHHIFFVVSPELPRFFVSFTLLPSPPSRIILTRPLLSSYLFNIHTPAHKPPCE